MGIGLAIKTSRPRFWLYLAGPFIVGGIWSISGNSDFSKVQSLFLNPTFLLGLLYFLLPANLLLYGINDLSDKEIDQKSTKKIGRENTDIDGVKEKTILLWFRISLLVSLLYFAYLLLISYQLEALLLGAFLLLSIFYSQKPIRFKARPFLDFASNFLYVLPGVISFELFSNLQTPWQILLAGAFWAWSMHLFSAIPDIKSDSKEGVTTSAVFLGREVSLLVCLIFWCISLFIISVSGASLLMILFGFLYPLAPLYLLTSSDSKDNDIYWKFPYLNAFYGFLIFLTGIVRFL
jgi:lycopene elongase/hydratase (dihydrobisanhydrobacterioruberin-forming)